MPCAADDMTGMQDSPAAISTLYDHGPGLGCFVKRTAFDGGLHPEVELHQSRVGLELVPELVLGCEEWPGGWKREMGQMVILDRIVDHKCLRCDVLVMFGRGIRSPTLYLFRQLSPILLFLSTSKQESPRACSLAPRLSPA